MWRTVFSICTVSDRCPSPKCDQRSCQMGLSLLWTTATFQELHDATTSALKDGLLQCCQQLALKHLWSRSISGISYNQQQCMVLKCLITTFQELVCKNHKPASPVRKYQSKKLFISAGTHLCDSNILNLLWSEFVETMSDVSICSYTSWSHMVVWVKSQTNYAWSRSVKADRSIAHRFDKLSPK